MVKSFQFSKLPLIYFGSGKINLLPGLIKRYGSEIVLVTNPESFIRSPFAAGFFNSLQDNGIKYHHVIIPGEPSPDMIDTTTRNLMNERIEVVVSIGGGSVLDAGKAVSAMLYRKESVKEFLEGVGTMEHPGTKIPFIALPTTSGTGSEATKNAVISQVRKDGYKKSLRHDNFVPDIAIIDPQLTLSCPKNITAASGMDCFTQLTESFLSDKATEYTDALALEGLKQIKCSLRKSFLNGDDLDARSGMAFAALTSGICLANAGLGVVHGFASSIGGLINIPHGVVCGTLMATANAVSVRELRNTGSNPSALGKYALLGRLFINAGEKSDEYYIEGFIDYLMELTSELELPRFAQYGIGISDIDVICRITELKNNPIKLSLEAMHEIVRERL
ncbi:MAG: iron-containing alcohol dehydrogenase [Bacteroidota bacterium]|nr:iron-containing alcohol dehydrogenase [Bacteroidota bacterium]